MKNEKKEMKLILVTYFISFNILEILSQTNQCKYYSCNILEHLFYTKFSKLGVFYTYCKSQCR